MLHFEALRFPNSIKPAVFKEREKIEFQITGRAEASTRTARRFTEKAEGPTGAASDATVQPKSIITATTTTNAADDGY